MKTKKAFPLDPEERLSLLQRARNRKMARSAHAFVRGNTAMFYEWLERSAQGKLPDGPAVWICGDCHVGNLGPLGNIAGKIAIQIRDLDQTVIGNPAHDLVRLGLSLASAARSSDLSGVITARMIEEMVEGYEAAFAPDESPDEEPDMPDCVRAVMRSSASRSWKNLARERIEDETPNIPLGRRFGPLSSEERKAVEAIFMSGAGSELARQLRSRDDDAAVEVVDAAYWMKGCSSLGLLRYAVLLQVGRGKDREFCLMDIKEATKAIAPAAKTVDMPSDNALRVVEGARHLSPYLGGRMRGERLLDKSVFVREILPQDLKLEIATLSAEEAMKTARYLATVVGRAHARQMSPQDGLAWHGDLQKNRPKSLEAPSWLWAAIVELLMRHESEYLEHCRMFGLAEHAA